jgi:hypothetical protein
MTRTTKILNFIYGTIILLFLLDGLTSFDIKNQTIKYCVYYGALIGSPFILIWNIFAIKTKSRKIIFTIFPAIIISLILIGGPLKMIYSAGSWRTQTILYQNKNLSFNTIEGQMQDMGALGYNTRTIEVIYITPLFMITSEVPNEIDIRVEWEKIDKYVNELEIKSP